MGRRKQNTTTESREGREEKKAAGRVEMGGESRQRLWQLLRSAEGRCEICSAPVTHYDTVCDGCAEKRRLHVRSRGGHQPWRPGGKGRPPKVRS